MSELSLSTYQLWILSTQQACLRGLTDKPTAFEAVNRVGSIPAGGARKENECATRWPLSNPVWVLGDVVDHPHNRAERRIVRRQIIATRLAHSGQWTTCWCGIPEWWFMYNGTDHDYRNRKDDRGEHARSGLCWNCFAHTFEPRWLGRLGKNKVDPEPNRERDWMYSGIIRRAYRAGGGSRVTWWGAKPGRHAGRFRLIDSIKEWC